MPASAAPSSVAGSGSFRISAVATAASIQAPGPTSQPQSSKKLWLSVRPVARPSTRTAPACASAARMPRFVSMRIVLQPTRAMIEWGA